MTQDMHKKSYLYRLTHHLRTIHKHHREVRNNCFACGLYKQGILHDLSKLSPAELFPSIKYYEGTRSPYSYEKEKYGYSLGWLHHKGRNKHHWEYWYDIFQNKYQPIEMPYKYVIEMVCDRVAACKVYQGDKYSQKTPLEYLLGKHDRFYMHPNTAKLLEEILTEIAENGEAATFKRIKNTIKNGNY